MNIKPFFDDIAGAFIAPIISVVIFAGFFIGAFPVIMSLISNMLSFFVLILIMPLAFYFLIFGNFTKGIFAQWFNMLLSNILTLIFLSAFGSMFFSITGSAFTDAINVVENNGAYWRVGAMWFAIGIFIKIFTSLIVSLAEKLTQVSLETAGSSSLASGAGITGAMAGVSLLGAGKVAKGILAMNRKARLDRAEGNTIHPINATKNALTNIKNKISRKKS